MARVSFERAENFIYNRPEGQGNHVQILQIQSAALSIIREELSERQREVVQLYYFEGRNIPQIAAELGVNKSTVSRTLARGLHNIEKRLEYSCFR